MRQVEAALAEALGAAGVVAPGLAVRVATVCLDAPVDMERLAAEAAVAATPVIPLLAALREGLSEEEARALHLGATSQDIIDTAMVLEVRDALDLMESLLGRTARRCATLAKEHRCTTLMGRTLLQEARPLTFGLLAARWVAALGRRAKLLRALRPHLLVVQLGGAVGTLTELGDVGPQVVRRLASELGLGVPELPWHAERDRVHDLAGHLAATSGVAGTIAADLVLLAGRGEAVPGARAGGSSVMPHKRNPTDAVAARAAARLATGEAIVLLQAGEHEHERAAGAWQLEWVAVPRLLVHACGALERLDAAVADLVLDTGRMATAAGDGEADQPQIDRLIDAALASLAELRDAQG